MDLSDDEASKVTNGFTSELFNETHIDYLVNFQNMNEPQNAVIELSFIQRSIQRLQRKIPTNYGYC